MAERLKHYALAKTMLAIDISAKEFLDYYLSADFKALLDLSTIKIEKESYIEESLRKKYSDLVYSVKCRDNDQAFVYILIETQSKPDYWIAFRLWKYMLLLIERHKKERKKLPLVAPIVLYHGKEKYNAPQSLWELFSNPAQAKQLMLKGYRLVDLQKMTDYEIKQKQHLGMLEYFLKHIHQRDMLKLWEQFLESFKEGILIDKAHDYIYIRSFLYYTDARVEDHNKEQLTKIITDNLSQEDRERLMPTIADVYIAQGMEKGRGEGIEMVAVNMLKANLNLELVSKVTGYPVQQVAELKNKLSN